MTKILDLEETRTQVDGLVHLDTQRAAVGLDLTVDAVFRLTDPGSLDFGGSEFREAGRTALDPALRDPEDDYGWWELAPGSYAIRYNESLAVDDGRLAYVLPLERLLAAGASHPAFPVHGDRDPLETLVTVGGAGCNLKENCRVSRIVVMERG